MCMVPKKNERKSVSKGRIFQENYARDIEWSNIYMQSSLAPKAGVVASTGSDNSQPANTWFISCMERPKRHRGVMML
jgi:hypothetical protein